MRVVVIGAGFVGLTTGVVFAEQGHETIVVESDPTRVSSLQSGLVPFHEPGLQHALNECISNKSLTFTSDLAGAVVDAEASFICVGTPQGPNGAIDLRFIERAAANLGNALRNQKNPHVVAVKSTTIPGTAADYVAPIVREASGRPIPVASNPEFLREGSALHDARHPDRIVIGMDDEGASMLWDLYSGFDCPKMTFSTTTAEMVKYVANSFLAVKIAFANEMANLCDDLRIDWTSVVEGIGQDERINPHFFQAGFGFGGSCFPKDVAALSALAEARGCPSGLLKAALGNNAAQPLRAISLLETGLGNLEGKRIALLGLAFKAETDDVRETRALPIFEAIANQGALAICHDPKAAETFRSLAPQATIVDDVYAAIAGADAVIIQTNWPEYSRLDLDLIAAQMVGDLIVDGRQTLDPAACAKAGLRYRGIGRSA